jgi:hypothetical protein
MSKVGRRLIKAAREAQAIAQFDKDGVLQLTVALMNDMRGYYKRMPTHRSRVYEVLHALAFVTAKTLEATDADRDQVRIWFDACLDRQLKDIDAAQEQQHEQSPTNHPRRDRH